ncbi:MAG: hypothetical protein JWM68_4405 [Verrucomicrobiales bacterium]|nr:hypothetical protein [Verrucomicrobiales bacterium]
MVGVIIPESSLITRADLLYIRLRIEVRTAPKLV